MSRRRSAPGRSSWPPALCSGRRRNDCGLKGRRRCHRDCPAGPGRRRNEPGRGAAARFVPGRRGLCRDGGAPPEGRRGRPALSGRRRDKHGVGGYRRARSPQRSQSRGGRAQPAARQQGGSSEPHVGRMAAGDTDAIGTFTARKSATGGASTTKTSDERDGGASALVRRAAGASAGRETKYCHSRGR